MVSYCISFTPLMKPELAEAMTLTKVMTKCWELNLSNIIFEGDYHIVVKAANYPKTNEGEMSPIIYDIQFMLHRV